MNDIFAMRRANGDWFVMEDHGRVRVPLFHSSHDALTARVRNFGMLLFQPVALDDGSLKQIARVAEGNVDFCIISDPFASLKRSPRVEPSELTLLVSGPEKVQTVPTTGIRQQASDADVGPQSEWWN
jgi:hypothetical protein